MSLPDQVHVQMDVLALAEAGHVTLPYVAHVLNEHAYDDVADAYGRLQARGALEQANTGPSTHAFVLTRRGETELARYMSGRDPRSVRTPPTGGRNYARETARRRARLKRKIMEMVDVQGWIGRRMLDALGTRERVSRALRELVERGRLVRARSGRPDRYVYARCAENLPEPRAVIILRDRGPMTATALAEEAGVTRECAGAWLRAYGVPVTRNVRGIVYRAPRERVALELA